MKTSPIPCTSKPLETCSASCSPEEPSHIYIGEFLAALDNNAEFSRTLADHAMLGKRDQWLDVARLITSLALQDSSTLEETLDRAIQDLRTALLDAIRATTVFIRITQ